MSAPSPFEVIGCPPTLDAPRVKRAYFAALAKHPPHQDPEGFRRLRAAYETLMRPDGLAAAFLAAPLDPGALLASYRERLDAGIAAARATSTFAAASAAGTAPPGAAAEHFVAVVSRLKLAEVLARFGPAPRKP